MKTVYLAGPISGLSYGGCTEWREGVRKDLAEVGIVGLSPMRAKDYLSSQTSLAKDCTLYGSLSPLSSNKGITTRDRFDTQRVDLVLVNLLGAKAVSIGTMIELGWADSARRPIVCAMEDGNIHEHGMVKELIGFRVPTLEEAVAVVKAILLANVAEGK